MPAYTLKRIPAQELKKIYRKIVFDFPLGEYPPYANIKRDIKQKRAEMFLYQESGTDCAYALCYQNQTDKIILISLFAVYKKFRGQGIGGHFLQALKEHYQDMKGIFLEVEKPEKAKSKQEIEIRKKRISFYERAGFHIVPQIKHYILWDIHYYIMAFSLSCDEIELDQQAQDYLYHLYYQILGERYIHRLSFTEK